jgi:hypothetical protein
MKFYIKERHNPQFEKPYYTTYGQLTNKAAKDKARTSYGTNYMIAYDTIEDYNAAIIDFKNRGYSIH